MHTSHYWYIIKLLANLAWNASDLTWRGLEFCLGKKAIGRPYISKSYKLITFHSFLPSSDSFTVTNISMRLFIGWENLCNFSLSKLLYEYMCGHELYFIKFFFWKIKFFTLWALKLEKINKNICLHFK
jgi:hypothetical protein